MAILAQIVRRARIHWLRYRGVQVGAQVHLGAWVNINPRYLDGGRVSVGSRSRLEQGVIIDTFGGQLEIGEDVFIGPYTVIYGQGKLSIGSRTLIAGHCFLVANTHQYQHQSMSSRFDPTSGVGIAIGADVWIGANVTVLDGIRIDDGAVIGAGAVVTRDVAASQIVAGVPARPIGHRTGNIEESG